MNFFNPIFLDTTNNIFSGYTRFFVMIPSCGLISKTPGFKMLSLIEKENTQL